MPSFQWAKACVAGASHVSCGAPCQDAIAVRLATSLDRRSYFIAAVCDGAGSARFSAKGSKIAANTFVTTIAAEIADCFTPDLANLARDAARITRSAVLRTATRAGHDQSDYATTLLGCITDGITSVFVQRGDGAIVIGAPWRRVFPSERGEYVNATRFLTEERALEELKIKLTTGPLGTVSLLTDGLEPQVVRGDDQVHPPLFNHCADVFAKVPRKGHISALSRQLSEFMSGPDVQRRDGDDASLITMRFVEGV